MLVDTAIILCGGRGTRFRKSAKAALVAQKAARNFKGYPVPRALFELEMVQELCETPKCLVSVCGKPLIWYKIDQLARAGVQNIIVCAGKTTSKTRCSLANISWDHPVSVSFAPYSFFSRDDLSDIARSLKGRPANSHIIITAGDCLTTTDYGHLATEHLRHNSSLTIATRETRGGRVFVQDSAVTLGFLSKAARETSHNLSRFPRSSPLNAAIFRAWQHHDLVVVSDTTDHININTVEDLARLLADPARFIPVAALGRPALLAAWSQGRPRGLNLPR